MSKLRWLVLDEADRCVACRDSFCRCIRILWFFPSIAATVFVNCFSRLLDGGFQQDLSFIFTTIQQNTTGSRVQKVLLSATLSKG